MDTPVDLSPAWDAGHIAGFVSLLTCPCNIDPLTPHFYIVKQGCAGVYIIFLFLLKNIDCGYSLKQPQ